MAIGVTVEASEALYEGPPLVVDYNGPALVDNGMLHYTGQERLSFSTAGLLAAQYPDLMPVRAAIDT